MKISFIGGGDRARIWSKIFFGRDGFEIGGFFCNPLSDCAQLAIDTNTKLYGGIDDLCADSDMIMIVTADRVMPSVINSLSKLHINGKIIVSAADEVHASELDTGYDNTYAVIGVGVAAEHLSAAEAESPSIVCEVTGKGADKLKSTFDKSGIDCAFVTPQQLNLYRTAMHLVHFGTAAVINAGAKLVKMSAGKNEKVLSPSIRAAIGDVMSGRAHSVGHPYTDGKAIPIFEHKNVLDDVGIDSITQMFKAVAAYLTETECADKVMADEIVRRLRQNR